MDNVLNLIFTTDFWFSVIRVTTPILFPAMAALITDKAGIINIGLEGTMLFSALMGVIFSALFQNAWLGLMGACCAGMLLALVLSYFTLEFKTDVILGGIAINLFADGGSIFILYLFTKDKGTSVSLASKLLPNINIPIIENIPVLGKIISGHNVLTYIAILMVGIVYCMLNKTPLGLRIKSVGENPKAAESVGISVKKIQYIALILSGFMASLGGAYMSMAYLPNFSRNITSGRGWIALAAEAMGHGSVIATTLTSFLFGFADALSNGLQMFNLPAELVGMIPYVTTILGLVIYAIRADRKKKKVNKYF